MSRTTLLAAGLSDVGRVRNRNEDALALEPGQGLAVVADGMGGHPAGDVASRLAVETAVERLSGLPDPDGVWDDDRGGRMREAVHASNDRILAEAETNPERRGMGTTLTALLVDPRAGRFLVGHVGDSRAYLYRAGALEQITRDDTWVQERIEAGDLPADVARTHPMGHMLTQALGTQPDVDVQVAAGDAPGGSLFLVCSDGLVGMLADHELEAILRDEEPADADALERTAERLVARANEEGGTDNITVALLRVSED